MNVEYFIKPGWKSFIVSLIIWYIGITLFQIIQISDVSFTYRYIFYTKFTWPSFLLCYTLVIWLIPKFFFTKSYGLLFISNILLIAGYITLRYYNSTYFDQYAYIVYKNSKYQPGNLIDIILYEAYPGLIFTIISYGYRLFFEWIIIEGKTRKLENEKLKIDLAMLRHQINPHFLFNSINNIYYLAIKKSDKTSDALLKLSELLRYVLNENNDLVPLKKEINYLNDFIGLHKIRFPDNELKIIIHEELMEKKFKIPPLVFITFIENAFKHGEKGTKEDPITIEIKIENETLFYRVENKINNNINYYEMSGIGKINLKKRLNILYPNRHKITFEIIDNKHIAQLEIPV